MADSLDEILEALKRIERKLDQYASGQDCPAGAKREGLTRAEKDFLNFVYKTCGDESATVGELSKSRHLAKSTIHHYVGDLSRQGYLKRSYETKPVGRGRRVSVLRIALTEKARKYISPDNT